LTAASQGSRQRLASLGAPREDAIPAAKRHSARVARLRRAIFWLVAAIVVGVAVIIGVQSLGSLPVDLRFARVGLNGTRITINTPKLVGYRQDGRPYELRARVGVQDLATPDIFELEGVDLRVETGENEAVLMTSGGAVYNAKTDHADLKGGVHIFEEKKFDLAMSRAVLDLKGGRLASDQASTLRLDGVTIAADGAEFAQSERRMSFFGHVHTVIEGEEDKADAHE
jgi:lipopolysaccharide export system protein LptC